MEPNVGMKRSTAAFRNIQSYLYRINYPPKLLSETVIGERIAVFGRIEEFISMRFNRFEYRFHPWEEHQFLELKFNPKIPYEEKRILRSYQAVMAFGRLIPGSRFSIDSIFPIPRQFNLFQNSVSQSELLRSYRLRLILRSTVELANWASGSVWSSIGEERRKKFMEEHSHLEPNFHQFRGDFVACYCGSKDFDWLKFTENFLKQVGLNLDGICSFKDHSGLFRDKKVIRSSRTRLTLMFSNGLENYNGIQINGCGLMHDGNQRFEQINTEEMQQIDDCLSSIDSNDYAVKLCQSKARDVLKNRRIDHQESRGHSKSNHGQKRRIHDAEGIEDFNEITLADVGDSGVRQFKIARVRECNEG